MFGILGGAAQALAQQRQMEAQQKNHAAQAARSEVFKHATRKWPGGAEYQIPAHPIPKPKPFGKRLRCDGCGAPGIYGYRCEYCGEWL